MVVVKPETIVAWHRKEPSTGTAGCRRLGRGSRRAARPRPPRAARAARRLVVPCPGSEPPGLARNLLDLIALLRTDMDEEERDLLDERVIRDDVVGIDVETG